ncbi:RNA polymerase sigma factor [Spongiimicrobium sp. 3-5]|uniref:RNA polymerase sigma factor n=1 Tax=Spongiimicrobium sp. 3-5 TaxID=3332596 RepID=UPI0039812D7F
MFRYLIALDSNFTFDEIKRRNRYAFRKIYDLYYEELVIYASAFLFDMASAEDMVQDVFIHLWERASDIHINTSLKAYLYSMTRNKALNHLKSLKITDKGNYLDLNAVLVSQNEVDSFAEEEQNVMYQKLIKVVDTFPPKMKKVFQLRYFNNCRYNEIADEMDISINTVKIQLKRAKVKIEKSFICTLLILELL